MTLEPYDADRIDRLILRIMDLAGDLRQASLAKRADPKLDFAIHDKKALQWIGQLEAWAADCRARMEMSRIKRQGERKARQR